MKKILLIVLAVGLVAVFVTGCKKSEDSPCTPTTWYQDADGDGKGNASVTISDCVQPAGYVADATDTNDINVVAKQRAVVTYVGATWCGPCGSYGDPTKIYMDSAYSGNAIILNCQNADAISTNTDFAYGFGNRFQSFVSNNTIPHVYYSGHGYVMTHNGFSSNSTSNINSAKTKIDAILAKTPEAGIGASVTRSGTVYTVKTKVVFKTASAAQHYIGVYLLEDGVAANQTMDVGASPVSTLHNNVVRVAADGATPPLGCKSIGLTFAADQTIEGVYTLNASPTWNAAKLQVAVILWEGYAADKISNGIILDVK